MRDIKCYAIIPGMNWLTVALATLAAAGTLYALRPVGTWIAYKIIDAADYAEYRKALKAAEKAKQKAYRRKLK